MPGTAPVIDVVDANAPALRRLAHEVRRQVFVHEQGVPEALEIDAEDATCQHVLARIDGRPVGAARFRHTARGFKLERVAVLPDARRAGVGAAIVRHVLERLPEGAERYVHSQQSAIPFWSAMGFVAEGPTFHEAGIPHRRMRSV
jgi:predicted GNAT family N-acyltransferase